MPCPLCNIYSSGWILSILGTNDHYHERVCRAQWPLTLIYIFKVIRPWLRKSYPLCTIYSSGRILFIYGTNDHYHFRVCRILLFLRIWKFEFLAIVLKFFGFGLEKRSTVHNGFFPYLAQMIISMRGCFTYNDFWPWTVSSRSFGLCPENRVRSVASPAHDGFFPDLAHMINSMRGCVVCDDPWPWLWKFRPWLRKSCPLCSVYSSRWILSIYGTNYHYHERVCRAWRFFRIWKFEFLANFLNFSALTFKKIYSCQWILCILSTNDH